MQKAAILFSSSREEPSVEEKCSYVSLDILEFKDKADGGIGVLTMTINEKQYTYPNTVQNNKEIDQLAASIGADLMIEGDLLIPKSYVPSESQSSNILH